MGTNPPSARHISRKAFGQHGNITRQQLLAIGLGDDAIDYRLGHGELHVIHAGVYSVGRPPRTALEFASAAVLACGPGAVLSHLSALALWGFTHRWPSRHHVTVPGDRRPARITVHRGRLHFRDTCTHHGIRTTSPARTLLDCAPLLTEAALARALNDARLSKHLKLQALAAVIERYPRHRGVRRVRALVGTSDGPTRSDWERAFPAFCARYGFPRPILGAKVGRHTVDALFPEEKLIVELDSWAYHQDRRAFETDRDRDADSLAAGYPTVRITWERMHATPAKEAARLQKILERLRAR